MKGQEEIQLKVATLADYPTIQNMARFYVVDTRERQKFCKVYDADKI